MANVALFGSIEAVFRGLTAIDHSTDFGDGSARYYFISRWFAWGASLIATYVLLRLKNPKPWKISAATLISAAAALANTFWRGGRSEGLMAVLPLILMTFRLHPVASKQSIRAIGMMLLFYVVSITLLRGRGDIASPITDIFDWHAGRFSMVGLGLEMAGNYGHDWGLTMLAPLLQTLNAPFYLLRLQEPFPVPYAITNLTGLYLLGDHTRTGIVPGSICELLYSFGIVGVPVGYYLLGRMVAFTSRHAEFGGTVGGTMAAFYVITLVCTGIIPGTMTTWVYYLVTLGFPCIFLWALELTGVFGLIRASNCCSRQPSGNTKAGGGLKKQTGFG
jgi:oligosaccharide repeat unit polymerase